MGFAAKATLQEHNRACQNQSGTESLHECPECGKIFCRQGQLRLHLKAHTGKKLINNKSVNVHSQLDLHNSILGQHEKWGILPAEFN